VTPHWSVNLVNNSQTPSGHPQARDRPGRISLSGTVIEPDRCRSHERSEQKEFGPKDTLRQLGNHQRLRGMD